MKNISLRYIGIPIYFEYRELPENEAKPGNLIPVTFHIIDRFIRIRDLCYNINLYLFQFFLHKKKTSDFDSEAFLYFMLRMSQVLREASLRGL